MTECRRSVAKNLEGKALGDFVLKSTMLDELYRRTGELEETIDALDDSIEFAQSNGLDELAGKMCASRNQLNLERLNLDIELHKLELELDEFEKVRMLTK